MKSITILIGSAVRVVELETDVKELGVLLKESNGFLNLSERFEKFFRTLPRVDQYNLVLRSNAGFTDTRIVYLWLKGEQWLRKADIAIYNAADEVEFASSQDFFQFFKSTPPSKSLVYSREPSIG